MNGEPGFFSQMVIDFPETMGLEKMAREGDFEIEAKGNIFLELGF